RDVPHRPRVGIPLHSAVRFPLDNRKKLPRISCACPRVGGAALSESTAGAADHGGSMRIRVFGQYVYLSIAILTIVEAIVFYGSVYGAVLARFDADRGSIARFKDLQGPLWTRALLFSIVMVTCLLAFGLYSARQRARFAGIVLRLGVALGTGLAATSALFYLIPDLWIGRGVMALAALGGLCGTVASRFIFARVVDESVFK